MTALSAIAMLPVNAIGMFVMFTKIANMANPSKVAAQMRQAQRMKRPGRF